MTAQIAKPKEKLSVSAKRTERLAWLFLIPTIIVVAGVAFYPLFNTFYVTFFEAKLGSSKAWEFVGFANYTKLLGSAQWWEAVFVTIRFTIGSVFLELVFGLGIALVVNSYFVGRGVLRTAMLVPWAIPTAVSSQMWGWMYHDVFGVFNDLFFRVIPILPAKIAWTANPSTELWALMAVDVWKTTPFMALLLLAGLQLISSDVYEASAVDGATGWRQFISITLPLLRPAIVVALIFRTLDALRVFDLFWIMTKNVDTMSTLNRKNLVDFQKLGYGSTISVAIFVVIAIFVLVYVAFIFQDEDA